MSKAPDPKLAYQSYLQYAYSLNYKEQPPSMEEFLCSPRYLGNLTGGGKAVYPIWKETLEVMSREDSKWLIVLTGAIGTGKTRCAIYGILYTMCRILCLKDPWAHFNLAAGGQMSIVFFNLTKSQSESNSYKLFQSHLNGSPWFKERGIVGGSEANPKVQFPLFKYTFASPFVQGFGSQGENVIAALMDEVDSPVASEVQRQKVIQAYENARRRLESRFVIKGDTLGRFFMVASKQERLSFLNAFIAKYKNDRAVMIVDIPLWKAKPEGTYCTQNFRVCVGDVHNPPFIVDNEEQFRNAIQKSFSVIEVPVDFYDEFTKDIVGSLRDIAGISVSHVRSTKLFPSDTILTRCYTEDPNPSKMITIEIGLKDDTDLLECLDLSALRVSRSIPRYIHVDYSFSGDGDASGIGMSCIKGWEKRQVEEEDGLFRIQRVPILWTDFVLRIKGRPGDKIPLAKIRKLILDLKNRKNINIRKVSYDLAIATEDTKQILERAGVECDFLSMDKDPQMYRGFRILVEEERWSTPFHPYLHFELKHLEDDQERNKIDHPNEVPEMEVLEDGSIREVVFKGSKDVADGGVGSVCLALRESQTPPDEEIMGALMDKAQRKANASESPDVFQLVGIDVKRQDVEEARGVSAEGVAQYTELLRRMKGRHQRGF